MSEPSLPRHWRKLYENKYLGCWSLLNDKTGQYMTPEVTIESVLVEEVIGEGGRREECTMLRFVGKRTPMILSRRQGKNIERLYGPDPNLWRGKKVTLWAEERKVKGELCRVLAIKTRSVRSEELKRELAPIESFEEEPGPSGGGEGT
jgi:hypothetical protein